MTRAHKRDVDKTALRATSGRSKPRTWASTAKTLAAEAMSRGAVSRDERFPTGCRPARRDLQRRSPPEKPWNGPWRISPSARRSSPARVSSQARSPGPRAPYRWRRPNANVPSRTCAGKAGTTARCGLARRRSDVHHHGQGRLPHERETIALLLEAENRGRGSPAMRARCRWTRRIRTTVRSQWARGTRSNSFSQNMTAPSVCRATPGPARPPC